MAVNKVIYGDETLMDITDSTVNPENVIENNVFYDRSGNRQVGILGDATTENHGLMSAADKAKLDEFQDASNYITEHQDISGKANSADLAAVATSGDYNDLLNTPADLSAFNNDVGYLTQHQDISGKANSADLASVATSGSYTDLADKPFIPSNVSDLTNDLGYITEHQDISGKANAADLAAVATSGSYNDLLNKPFIPSAISDLTDDSGHYTKPSGGIPAEDLAETYLTQHQDISGKANSADLATVATSGAYSDLSGIPTNVSSFTNDAGYLTTHQDISNKLDKSTIALNYEDLTFPVKKHTECFYNGELYFARVEIETSEAWTASHWKKQTLGDQITKDRQNIDLINSKKYEKPETGIPASDLEETYLTSYTETDPTVPSWAKAVNKPSYTASEVGAPTVSEMNTAIATAIGNVHQFSVEVVQELPTTNIKEHTVYFVPKAGETNDVYDEYIYVNNAWEMIGNTQIDLSNYATKSEIPTVPVQDVQIRGSSILSNGIATIPVRTNIVGGSNDLVTSNAVYNTLTGFFNLTSDQIKEGTIIKAVSPSVQHISTFYGLAKAAGDTTQSQSDNAVGTYTAEAKAAIRSMIGAKDESYAPDLSNYVQKTDYVTADTAGIVSITNGTYGLAIGNNGLLTIAAAGNFSLKTGQDSFRPITPDKQHMSVFYGLATAAGDTTQSQSDNAIGTYTADAKAAIRTMLDVASTARATTSRLGLIKVGNGLGITDNDGLYISFANDNEVKSGVAGSKAMAVTRTPAIAFYGLAAASGDTTQSQSNNAIGTYTADAKAAIQTMLDVPSNADLALKVDKIDTVLETTLSIGRKANTIVGTRSVAIGNNTEASGNYSFSNGNSTVASGANAKAEGYGAVASGSNSHAEGNGTIANGSNVHAEGKYNTEQVIFSDWIADTHYNVGDKVYKLPTTYECIEENTDSSWTAAHWKIYGFTSEVALVIGNGTSNQTSDRSNAYMVDWSGNGHYAGNIYVGCNNDSTGGTRLATITEVAEKLDASAAGLEVVRLI